MTYSTASTAGLSFSSDGSYSFDAGNAAYNHLAEGATQNVVVNYTVTDEHGVSAASALTITVTGANDAPVAVADTANATEGGATISGSVATNDSDVDDGAVLTYSTASTAGLSFSSDGSYSFDAGNAAYDHLAEGATQNVVVTHGDGRAPCQRRERADDHGDGCQRRADLWFPARFRGGCGRHHHGRRLRRADGGGRVAALQTPDGTKYGLVMEVGAHGPYTRFDSYRSEFVDGLQWA